MTKNPSTTGYTPDLLFCIVLGKGLKVRSTLLVTNIAYLALTPWKDTEQLMLGLTPLTFTLRLILQGRTLCRGAVLERK